MPRTKGLCDELVTVVHKHRFAYTVRKPPVNQPFECRVRQFLPPDIKGLDVIQEGSDIVLLQMAYLDTKKKAAPQKNPTTKLELR